MRRRLVRSWKGGGSVIATAAIMTLVMIACAKGTDSVDVSDEGGAGDARGDLVVIPDPDSSIPPIDGGTDAPVDSPPATGTHVVINELQTEGSNANDEFVELYNPTSSTVSLANWEIRYASGGGGAGGAGHKFNGTASIAAGAYLVLSGGTWTPGMQQSDGQLGLFNATLPAAGTLIDGIGYGTVSGGSIHYNEGQSAPSPPASGSIGRSPNGGDTDSNKTDFKTFATPTSGNAN
jgi:Lamin Tail Domain